MWSSRMVAPVHVTVVPSAPLLSAAARSCRLLHPGRTGVAAVVLLINEAKRPLEPFHKLRAALQDAVD